MRRLGRGQSLMLCAVTALYMAGCAAPSPQSPRLRIVNTGSRGLDALVVQFPAQEVPFGRLSSGGATDRRAVEKGVFRYAAYRFTVDGREYGQPVIDWVGESPMEGQDFTYTIELVDEVSSKPTIRLVSVVRDR